MGEDRRRYPTQPPGTPVYAYPEERTAPGVGMQQQFQPPPVPTLTQQDDPFIRWAKTIVAIAVGVAAVGAVLGAIGEAFYVSKSKYEEDQKVEVNFKASVNSELSRLSGEVARINKESTEAKADSMQLQIDITRLKTVVFKRNRMQGE